MSSVPRQAGRQGHHHITALESESHRLHQLPKNSSTTDPDWSCASANSCTRSNKPHSPSLPNVWKQVANARDNYDIWFLVEKLYFRCKNSPIANTETDTKMIVVNPTLDVDVGAVETGSAFAERRWDFA